MCRDENPDNRTNSECSSRSIKEHKGHNNIETAVSRGEVGVMGDSMGGDDLEVAVSLKISRTFQNLAFCATPKVHKPQGISLLCENWQGGRGHS